MSIRVSCSKVLSVFQASRRIYDLNRWHQTSVSSVRQPILHSRFLTLMANRDLFYDDIVKLSSRNEIVLIDVREPSEILETGKLPGSIHIPLGEVPSALSLDASSFEQKYGIPKPGFDAPLVFSCRSGKRSQVALKGALDLGYDKSRHYAGGWLDWESHTKQNS